MSHHSLQKRCNNYKLLLLSFTSSSVVKTEVFTVRDSKSEHMIPVILVARNLHLSMR